MSIMNARCAATREICRNGASAPGVLPENLNAVLKQKSERILMSNRAVALKP